MLFDLLGDKIKGVVIFLRLFRDKPGSSARNGLCLQGGKHAPLANKTQSGWKTRSTPGGGAANFNEIRFEDKKGREEIYIHAEKDQNNVVENDETTVVGHDRTIGNNRTENVGKSSISSRVIKSS